MAKKFLTSIDLNQNELQYAVVHALATAPDTGSTGQIYFNTSDNYLYQYYNSAWHAVGVPTPQNAYALDNGSVSSNSVPIRLYENGTIKNTVNIKGAGGATITSSNGTITITSDDTTYSIAGNWSSGYLSYDIIMTDVNGNNYTAEIPMASLSPANPGLMTSDMASKLNGIETGAEVNVQADWNVTDTSSDSYIRNKPTIPEGIVVDQSLDTSSTNSIANKPVAMALNGKATGNSRIFYGTSSTAAGTDDKVVACSSYDALTTGDILVVNFSSVNTASYPTLNVNSKGAKEVRSIYNGGAASTLKYSGEVQGTCIFVYDGTYWLLQHSNDDTTYATGTEALLTTGTDTVNRVWQAKILHDYIATVVGGVDAMRFKGTVNSNSDLPTTGVKVGDTYMVNTAGTYAGQTCEVGDLIIATATTPTWTVAQTNIDGAITNLSGTAPISVSGSGSSRTIGISAASGSADGSMSAAHYTKLEGIAAGAEVNVQSDWNQTSTSADDYIKNKPILLTQQSATIAAGSTSTSISSSYTVLSYKAEMSNTEVVVDFSSSNNTWSIASAQSAAVTINAVVSG